jgi:hypothetical protein
MAGIVNNEFQAPITGVIDANGETLDIKTSNSATTVFQLTGTWSGTIVTEISQDGTNYAAIPVFNQNLKIFTNSQVANGLYLLVAPGIQFIRLRASAWTSGSVTVFSAGSDHFFITKSSIHGRAEDGNYYEVQVDDQGRLVTSAVTGFGADFSNGDITAASTSRAAVRRTAYTEQTSNAQRSVLSGSANDTAAGTGARTMRITYLDSTGAGPFTEDITLNGTTPVNTVATNICFIESMEILTVGSGGANAGLISLRATTAGGGATVGTIATGDNQTFWAHHYVPSGRECNITGLYVNHSGTTVGSGAVFAIFSLPIPGANMVEKQISDSHRLYGQSSTVPRAYISPLKVQGPARLTTYVTPETSSSTVYRASMDFFEP